MASIRVLVIEDHAVVRQGLIALLTGLPDIEVIGSAADGVQGIEVFRAMKPDVTLVDLQMPRMGGVETIRRLREEFSGARCIVLKGMEMEELLTAIRTVHAGRASVPPSIAEKLAQRVSSQDLTQREISVLQRIVAGRANKEFASDLNISEATVKSHVNSLLGKLGVDDRTNAAMVALQRGIVHLP